MFRGSGGSGLRVSGGQGLGCGCLGTFGELVLMVR